MMALAFLLPDTTNNYSDKAPRFCTRLTAPLFILVRLLYLYLSDALIRLSPGQCLPDNVTRTVSSLRSSPASASGSTA